MAFLKLPMFGGLKIEDWFRQVWAMLNRRVGGTYTPTVYSSTNVSSTTIFTCNWTRIDDLITVTGVINATNTSGASVSTQLVVSVPILPVSTGSGGCTGIGTSYDNTTGVVSEPIVISGGLTDRVYINWTSSGTNSKSRMFTFTYRVV